MSEQHAKGNNTMLKIAEVIVDKRNLFFLITIIGIIFSAFSINWVSVENNLVEFLPDNSATKQGIDLMEEEFTTFASAQFMVANVTLEKAYQLQEEMEAVDGVWSVEFDDSSAHYNNVSALYAVTFDYESMDPLCEETLNELRELVSGYDNYVYAEIGDYLSDTINAEVQVIIVYVAIIVGIVLVLTSKNYGEVPVLALTFLTGIILNMGTSFLMGTISFVSNSVTSVLQLALSLDYAIILSNRYREELETLPRRDAVIVALSKAIPEIASSSLTTIGGLIAMMFMQFKLGPDMAINLIKSIFFALLSVFVVMPGLLMLFGPLMDKTAHKNFIPKIDFVGKFAYKTRWVVPPVFVALAIAGWYFSGMCPFAYGYGPLEAKKVSESQLAQNMISENFASSTMVAVIVPGGDYETEAKMLAEFEAMEEVSSSMGLANVEALDGYTLTEKLTPRQFAELADLDYEMAQLVYAAYAADQEQYGKLISDIANYSVPLLDMFLFVCGQVDAGLVSLEGEQAEMITEAQRMMNFAKLQLQGKEYSRMLVYLNLPASSEETYRFTDMMKAVAQKYYPDGEVFVVGNPTNEYEFLKSFEKDNPVVSTLSILIVLVVLLFTFKSVGMPVLLILVIQGSIWLNFSFPYFTQKPIFFMCYMIASSIQMGANIDYAIVIASRYMELKNEMSHKDAIIDTMNFAFPTILTSGTIMMVAGFLIGNMTSDGTICGMGMALGRGTLISIVLVLFVLPQILLIGGTIIDKTSFAVPAMVKRKRMTGKVTVDGMVTGEIAGSFTGMIRGVVEGEVNLTLVSGAIEEAEAEAMEEYVPRLENLYEEVDAHEESSHL